MREGRILARRPQPWKEVSHLPSSSSTNSSTSLGCNCATGGEEEEEKEKEQEEQEEEEQQHLTSLYSPSSAASTSSITGDQS